jgi:hypothetical protein
VDSLNDEDTVRIVVTQKLRLLVVSLILLLLLSVLLHEVFLSALSFHGEFLVDLLPVVFGPRTDFIIVFLRVPSTVVD